MSMEVDKFSKEYRRKPQTPQRFTEQQTRPETAMKKIAGKTSPTRSAMPQDPGPPSSISRACVAATKSMQSPQSPQQGPGFQT